MNKVLNILENGFFSTLSDGSQASETKHDKETVLIRTEKMYFINYFDHFSSSQSSYFLLEMLSYSLSYAVKLKDTQMRYFFS